jgi:ankyrin repeat protein
VLRFGCLGHCHNLRSLNLEKTFVFASKFKGRNFWKRLGGAEPGSASDFGSFSRSAFDPTRRVELDAFKSLTRLEELNLSHNAALGEVHIQALRSAQLTRLTSLDLSYSGHKTNSDPIQVETLSSMLSALTNLKSLMLHKIALTGREYTVETSKWEDDDDETQEPSSDGEEGLGDPSGTFVWTTELLSPLQCLKKLERVSLPSFIVDWTPLKDLPALKTLIISDQNAKAALQELSRSAPKDWVLDPSPAHLGWYLPLMEGMSATIFVALDRVTTDSFFHAACSAKSDVGIVAHLLSLNDKIKAFDPNVRDLDGRTPLMVARTTTVAKILVDAGADLNATSSSTSRVSGERRTLTPLMSAINSGNDQLVSLLMSHGASLLLGTPSPLLLAAKHSKTKMRALVLAYAPDILLDMKQDDLFAIILGKLFHTATPDVLMQWLDLIGQEKVSAFAKYSDSYRRSALHALCARYRHASDPVIHRLLDAGADPSLRDNNNLSPLWCAIQSCPYETVNLVLSFAQLTPETDCRGMEQRSCLGSLLRKGYGNLFLNAAPNFKPDHFTCDPTPVAYDMCRRLLPHEVSAVLAAVGDIDFNCSANAVLQDDRAGKYPIFGALANARGTHLDLLQLLIDKGANPDVSNQFGIPVLMMSYDRDMRALHLLLKAGANPNCMALPRTSSVVAASHLGRGSKPIPSQQISMLNQTALTYAISKSNVDIVKALLDSSADPDLPNALGFTPLTCLFNFGSGVKKECLKSILDLLLAHNVDVNRPDAKDTTPLAALMRIDNATILNKKTLFLSLFDAGAKPTSWKRYEGVHGRVVAENMSPSVMEAAIEWRSFHHSIIDVFFPLLTLTPFVCSLELDMSYLGKILDMAPELIEQPTSDRKSLLAVAVAGLYSATPGVFVRESREKDLQLVRFLLERGADSRARDRHSCTVMEYCIAHNAKEAAKIIIDHDREKNKDAQASDPKFVDIVDAECTSDDMTPLVRAADSGRLEMVHFLLDEGADVNRLSGSSFALDHVTALHIAVLTEGPRIVAALLKRGADVHAKSRNRTALAEALNRSRIDDELVHLLVEGGSVRAGLSDVQLVALDQSLARWQKRQKTSASDAAAPVFSLGMEPSKDASRFTGASFSFGSSSPAASKPEQSPFSSPFSTSASPFGSTAAAPFASPAESPFASTALFASPASSSPFASATPASPNTAPVSLSFGTASQPFPTSPPAFASPFGSAAPIADNPFASVVTSAANPFESVASPSKSDVPNPFQ